MTSPQRLRPGQTGAPAGGRPAGDAPRGSASQPTVELQHEATGTEGEAQDSDAATIAAVLGGDVEAFADLVRRYRDTYARFATRMLGSREDAEDVLQTAFVRAFRNLDRCQNPARFGAWLYQIVVNECLTLATRRAKRERRFLRDEDELARPPARTTRGDVALREEIQHALDRLDPEQREAFILKHVEDLSYDEMAELTGAGVSALKMRVKRACDRLKVLLEGIDDV